MKQSTKFTLNLIDWKSIGIGALKVTIGALLTYLTPIITGFDFGVYTPFTMLVLTTLTNVIWKWVSGPAK